MKFLPIIVGVIAAVLLLIGHLVQSLSVLSYIGVHRHQSVPRSW